MTPQEERSPQPRVMVTTPRTISKGTAITGTATVPLIAKAAISAAAITTSAATNSQPVSLCRGAAGAGAAGGGTAREGAAAAGTTGLSALPCLRTVTEAAVPSNETASVTGLEGAESLHELILSFRRWTGSKSGCLLHQVAAHALLRAGRLPAHIRDLLLRLRANWRCVAH